MSRLIKTVIVTHNSAEVLERCLLQLLSQQHKTIEIIIIDCQSDDINYLYELQKKYEFSFVQESNLGYGKANNLGSQIGSKGAEFMLFLNPDTFLSDSFLSQAILKMDEDEMIGVISGKLLSFDHQADKSTGKIDSTGIFRSFYGRWYDRGRGSFDNNQYDVEANVPALCGASLFCRFKALERYGNDIFDPDFFMYKEDIEFCLRLRRDGWQIRYVPALTAFHCRGWNDRKTIPFSLRKIAAFNEVLLYKKHPSFYMLWALFKYLMVVSFRI